MIRHLAKLLDSIWYLSMGLFLGLTGGLVLSVILTFRGAREIDASPGVEPFNAPQFAEYSNEAVAGYIGQNLFMVGGTVALVLLGVAFLTHLLKQIFPKRLYAAGNRSCIAIQSIALCVCVLLMIWSAMITITMNDSWPKLYDTSAPEIDVAKERYFFDRLHQQSERAASAAWACGLIALLLTPWCRRPADTPLQSSDGDKEKVNQEEAGQTEEA